MRVLVRAQTQRALLLGVQVKEDKSLKIQGTVWGGHVKEDIRQGRKMGEFQKVPLTFSYYHSWQLLNF